MHGVADMALAMLTTALYGHQLDALHRPECPDGIDEIRPVGEVEFIDALATSGCILE